MKVKTTFKSDFLCLASFAVSGIEYESWVWWLPQVIPALQRLRLQLEATLGYIMNSRLTCAIQPNPVRNSKPTHILCTLIMFSEKVSPFSNSFFTWCLDQEPLTLCYAIRRPSCAHLSREEETAICSWSLSFSWSCCPFPAAPPPNSHTPAPHSFPFCPFKNSFLP